MTTWLLRITVLMARNAFKSKYSIDDKHHQTPTHPHTQTHTRMSTLTHAHTRQHKQTCADNYEYEAQLFTWN